MVEYKRSSHAIYDIKYHIIWVTKYRYKMLRGKIAERLRDLIRQGCEARKITIVQGSIGKDHVHLLISCPPDIAPSKIVQYLKGRSSKLIQDEFPELKRRYWGQHIWARGYFCATVGTVTEETIRNYIENQEIRKNVKEVFKIED
ncbi:transposase [Caloranaerobacter azorensis H53214]|uniref:Transposase n=1 Tax=Caloranaerobacter azorensis H53214 TaxID=1156417 RepID=A0A096BHX6_9FIRM|nr:IS200/IS605 family transposase [Caloranaerobacter azorensis]KGG80472.1 transposase [Caloranaerobacter azorensis H53214]